MKAIIATLAASLALTMPLSAQTTAEELFAMSNDSAAETIVREHSMGDITAAQIAMALENMSAAERKAFFDETPATRAEIISCMHKTDAGDSAAESCAIGN